MKTLTELSDALREQRKHLALNQKDMRMKIGMSQQQYQRIEAGADLRVSTLMRVLEGMDLEMVLLSAEQGERAVRVDYDGQTDRASSLAVQEGRSEPGAWDAVIGHLEDD